MKPSHWSRSVEILCSDWLDHDFANAMISYAIKTQLTVSL